MNPPRKQKAETNDDGEQNYRPDDTVIPWAFPWFFAHTASIAGGAVVQFEIRETALDLGIHRE
jgi:hypothetical protein